MEQVHDTREGWLSHAFVFFGKRFAPLGYSVPDTIRISCGFPVGSRGGKKILGQAISHKASAGGLHETFVSPTISEPIKVLGVALHEWLHHAVGVEAGHGPKFKQACRIIGLVGKATEALPGDELNAWLRDEVLPELGSYPHAAVDPSQREGKQTTRMIKLVCPETGYTVRTTKKWLAVGVPTSPAGHEMIVEGEEGGEE